MLLPSPDQQPDPQKEAVLANCPFTKHFLDKSALHSDPKHWSNKFKELSAKLESKIESNEGSGWKRNIMNPLFLTTIPHKVLNPKMSVEEQTATIETIFYMGYEMGNENWKPLLVDIVVALTKMKSLNPEMLISIENKRKAIDVCYGIIKVGAYFKVLESGKEQKHNDKPPILTDSVRKFIEGLNLDGI